MVTATVASGLYPNYVVEGIGRDSRVNEKHKIQSPMIGRSKLFFFFKLTRPGIRISSFL